MLEKVRPFGAQTDHLFIGTLRFQYFTVVWNPKTRQLDTVQSFIDVAERHMQNSQSRDRCLVDPSGGYLAMELFQGILNLVQVIKPRKGHPDYLDKPEQVRITELKVRASTFLYTETNRPKLAILYDAGKIHPDLRLATYRIVDEKKQYSQFDPNKDRENDIGNLDIGASHLIPVPKGEAEQRRYIVRNASTAKAQLGGVIIVGETKMTYLDDESKAIVEYPLEEASVWVAWERYDDLRYLLADNYARLHLLTITVDGAVVTGLDVKQIGKITKATVLVHMGDGLLFIASHEGDSQVVRLDIESENPSIELLQTMANVAPILDFAVMDMGGRDGETQTNEYSSGQARLVTGSGGWEEGSLRRCVLEYILLCLEVSRVLTHSDFWKYTDFEITTVSGVELVWKILGFLRTWKLSVAYSLFARVTRLPQTMFWSSPFLRKLEYSSSTRKEKLRNLKNSEASPLTSIHYWLSISLMI
jgi:DNA damage-binding protein 1